MSVAATRASHPARRVGPRRIGLRLPALDWWTAAYAGAGLVIGGWLGSRYGFELEDPATWEWFTPEFGTVVTTAGLLVGFGLFGLLLSFPQSTRPFGVGLLTTTVFVIAGFPVGAAMGPKWQLAETRVGHVRVELTEPVAQVLEASATCTRLANGGRAGTLEASPLGRVGIDELRLRLDWAASAAVESTAAQLRLRVNTNTGYVGVMSVVESGHDRLTGRGTFSGVESQGGWIGGRRGTASGSISWDCTGGTLRTPAPGASPTEEISSLQGWFHLHGIVTVDRDSLAATPPFEGMASGACSRAYALRTRAIETVVPWVDGGRARLHLVPEATRATLTVDLGDGSTPETVTALATFRFLNDAETYHSLTAVFPLRAGRLGLTVEWWCPG